MSINTNYKPSSKTFGYKEYWNIAYTNKLNEKLDWLQQKVTPVIQLIKIIKLPKHILILTIFRYAIKIVQEVLESDFILKKVNYANLNTTPRLSLYTFLKRTKSK